MRTHIVLTLTGKDRVGLVQEITELLFQVGGNVETSQMARLGGEFAILMLVSLPSDQLTKLEPELLSLSNQGYKLTTTQTEPTPPQSRAGWRGFQIVVEGADHEGIVHEVAQSLSKQGISIESMETSTHPAPMSGSPLFRMNADVIVPPELVTKEWQAALRETGQRLNVEIDVAPAKS